MAVIFSNRNEFNMDQIIGDIKNKLITISNESLNGFTEKDVIELASIILGTCGISQSEIQFPKKVLKIDLTKKKKEKKTIVDYLKKRMNKNEN